MENVCSPPDCITLVQKYEEKQKLEKQKIKENLDQFSGKILPVELVGEHVGKDTYNPSRPFQIGDDNKNYICLRVEPSNVWQDKKFLGSQVLVFEEGADCVWRPAENTPNLPLEDAFVVPIDKNEMIIGGVKAYHNPTAEHPDKIDYHTVFYSGCNLKLLREFARGPDQMKDIRFIILPNGHAMVFTRPHGLQPDGEDYGRGVIACIELPSYKDINPENLLKAKIIKNQFAPGDWGGANELYLLPDGRIGVLGHIAYIDELRARHYYAMAFIYDPKTHRATPIEIIATRADFPVTRAKALDLVDVAFPGGMVRDGKGMAIMYLGGGDTTTFIKKIFDPFLQKEFTESETVCEAGTLS